jgi:putative Holliday junction resolvase
MPFDKLRAGFRDTALPRGSLSHEVTEAAPFRGPPWKLQGKTIRLPTAFAGLRRQSTSAPTRDRRATPMRRPTAIEDLALSLPPKARLIGIDLGSKTIGLAISDVERRLASPLKTLPRGAFAKDADSLIAIFSEFDIAGIVLGLPLDLDGRDNPRAQSTRAFARNLSTRTTLPIVFWDERFSTAVVTRSLIANDVSRARRAQIVDKMAAAYILQGALDRLGGMRRPETDDP